MEGRTRRPPDGSTRSERSKIWIEPPAKHRTVPVVYYLCRNGHLDHPHFLEITLSSPHGLYLIDVIDRLSVLRGKGMPARYSWSCKRRYKSGFVWHDLEEDDLVIPAHSDEYVLKGSELLDCYSSAHSQQASPTSSGAQEASSSSSSPTVVKEAKPHPHEGDELSPASYKDISLESTTRSHPSSNGGSTGLAQYKALKANGSSDASTQTEDTSRRTCGPKVRITGVSTDNEPLDLKFSDSSRNRTLCLVERCENGEVEMSPFVKSETLESLIRADASKMSSCRLFDEEVLVPSKAKPRATNILMQLITCGSFSVKDYHSFGLVPAYKLRLSHMGFRSPTFSSSLIMREHCIGEIEDDRIEAKWEHD